MTLQLKFLFSFLSLICGNLYSSSVNLKQKALRGDVNAQVRLAFIYVNKKPTEWNRANYWFQQASEQDQTDACFWLGHIFQHGLGTPLNLSKSIYFYEKGASLGSTDCSKALALLYQKQFKMIQSHAWKIIYLDALNDHLGQSALDIILPLSSFEMEEAKLLATEIKRSWLVKTESPILDPKTKAPIFGDFTLKNGTVYKGSILKGKPHGYGMKKSSGGESYFGYFKDGRMHGSGTLFTSDGQIIFKGGWSDGVPLPK